MSKAPDSPRLAVLIDGENVPAKLAKQLFEEIAGLGEASVRRIYGDFSGGKMNGWAAVQADFGIIPQHFPTVSGKNSSDIAMVIDAMDLLHSGRFEGFCLVTADGDFTRLAARIREQGKDVFGFGERKAPKGLVQVCKRFIYLENISVPEEAPRTPAWTSTYPDVVWLLRAAIERAAGDDGGSASLSAVGSQLLLIKPDFDPRDHGHKQLSALFSVHTKYFTLDRSGKSVWVRLKPEGWTEPRFPPIVRPQAM
jgi:uncharacterized protein (TIGR00288 family)